jgi:hypothetical protein
VYLLPVRVQPAGGDDVRGRAESRRLRLRDSNRCRSGPRMGDARAKRYRVGQVLGVLARRGMPWLRAGHGPGLPSIGAITNRSARAVRRNIVACATVKRLLGVQTGGEDGCGESWDQSVVTEAVAELDVRIELSLDQFPEWTREDSAGVKGCESIPRHVAVHAWGGVSPEFGHARDQFDRHYFVAFGVSVVPREGVPVRESPGCNDLAEGEILAHSASARRRSPGGVPPIFDPVSQMAPIAWCGRQRRALGCTGAGPFDAWWLSGQVLRAT